MSTPATADITFVIGDTFSQQYQLLTCDKVNPASRPSTIISAPTTINGFTFTPIDTTGCLVKAQIRRTVGTTETLLADFAITINDDTTGLFTISLSHTTTAALVLNDNASDAYDIQLTTASGVVTTYVSGNVVLVGDVTR